MINLINDAIDNSDIDNLVEWLKTYPRLTKGPQTKLLEEKWSKWLGRKYSVFCNSGSSANLLMLAALKEGKYLKNNNIVIPGVAWATDLAPAIQLGYNVSLCDVNMDNLSVDLRVLETIFESNDISVLMLVSVLGLVPNMTEIVDLCKRYGVLLLEDACESLGSTYHGVKLGTVGLMSSFSTFFGHHISTIEGGFVSTDSFALYELLLSLRSHGWDRDLSTNTQDQLQNAWNISEFDALYTFYNAGFNLRSTDLQAYIGLRQLDKLDKNIDIRHLNYKLYRELLQHLAWTPPLHKDDIVSNFAFPIISTNRDKIVKKLQENNVEVRPLICGSMGSQPFYVKHNGAAVNLPNADYISKFGMYLPNHPGLSPEDIHFICKLINEEL
jgi:CDP-4-dehydro-6-deoxyglucose reductase, E1